MDLADGNPLAESLRTGRFCALIEYDTPGQEQPFESAVALGTGIAAAIADHPLVAGMTVTDRLHAEECHDPIDVAARLMAASHKPSVLHVAGKGSSPERVRDLAAKAASEGVRSVLAVTGNRAESHRSPAGKGKRAPAYEKGYLDSVDIIALLKHAGQPLFKGAGINPFKYDPVDLYLQYFKMLRKLNSGAEFIVTHFGWDMKKRQELQWFLRMRGCEVPVIARLALLSAENIARIHEDPWPGVRIARPFAAQLQRESSVNAAQCLSAQLRRIALQAAGCKLLGYSGVQLVGMPDAKTCEMVLTKIDDALSTYTAYPDWLAAWHEHHHGIDFAPVPDAYYVFTGLLESEQPMYDPENCPLTHQVFPLPARLDVLRSKLIRSLGACGPTQRVADALFCRGCRQHCEDLRYCFFLCPADCPKVLVYGPCGGSGPDGVCEFGHAPCFFRRVLALASHKHALDTLEEGIARV